jgi:hypothetical protein
MKSPSRYTCLPQPRNLSSVSPLLDCSFRRTSPSRILPGPDLAQLTSGADFVLIVLVSLLVTAASMYLPNHVTIIYKRLWYYVHGEIASITKSNGAVGEVVKTAVNGAGTRDTADMVTVTSSTLKEL